MRRLAVLGLAALAGCAARPGEDLWRDMSGQGRQDAALHSDQAACEYEIALATSAAPYNPALGHVGNAFLRGPGPRVWDACMRARGWQVVGRG